MSLRIKDLHVFPYGKDGRPAKEIISGLSLSIASGELAVIMGPNGSGKSSLCHAIMGNPAFRAEGSVELDGRQLSGLGPDERAGAGLFLAFQEPEEVEGVKIGALVRRVRQLRGGGNDMASMLETHEEMEKASARLRLDEGTVSRELNVGFSGGEKKRSEVLQMLALKPSLIIFDEIDSGLDVDGIRLIAKAVDGMRDGKRSFIFITHYPRLLRYLKADRVHVLVGGRIVKSGGHSLALEIEEQGYSEYMGGQKAKSEKTKNPGDIPK
jgi:Fe-S cluster assembly ATP-binding protein